MYEWDGWGVLNMGDDEMLQYDLFQVLPCVRAHLDSVSCLGKPRAHLRLSVVLASMEGPISISAAFRLQIMT